MKESSKDIDWGKVKITKDIMDGAIKVNHAEHDKGKGKQLDDVDLNDLDLENKIKKLEEDFGRMLKAKKGKEVDEAELKVNKVVQVSSDEDDSNNEGSDEDDSSDEGLFGDEDVVLFNDVKYSLTDVEIRMFKERPTTSKAHTRQLASNSTRYRAPTRQLASNLKRSIAPSTRSKAPTTSTSAPKCSMKEEVQEVAMIGFVVC
nr:hypothetical protein [Tanacetum cinerariifolium]